MPRSGRTPHVNVSAAEMVLRTGKGGLTTSLRAAPACGSGLWWAQPAPSDTSIEEMKSRVAVDMVQS
jgi:hypothetical protein